MMRMLQAIHPDVRRLFPEAQVEEVERAVAQAERKTSAEIVAWVVPSSDGYAEAEWRGVAVGLLSALGILAALWWRPEWTVVGPWMALGVPLGGAAVGYLVGRWIPVVRRWLVGSELVETRVRAKATEAFVDAEVFATSQRTGLLIFVSLFERLCVVLPDRVAAEKLDAAAWSELAGKVAEGVRSGAPAPALVEVIERFGEMLADAGLAVAGDDKDELPDRMRFEEP